MSTKAHRREGMADAVVQITLKRLFPNHTAEWWCEQLGLERADIAAALERLKPRRYGPAPGTTKGRTHRTTCEHCGREVGRGLWFQRHMVNHHPDEWARHLEELAREYATCEICGEPIEVCVTVKDHVCSAERSA